MEINERKTISDNLHKYCYLAKDDDFIEITEWTNGEGFDVTTDTKSFSITRGELEAIDFLIKCLEFKDKE